MTAKIPESHIDLIAGPVVVALVTVMPDGQPQATPVWCNTDGTHVLVNTARGRQKDRNMQTNARVTILAVDPENPYRYVEVRGRVAEVTEEGALDHINTLAKLYTGRDEFYTANSAQHGKETRVTYKIVPHKVNTNG